MKAARRNSQGVPAGPEAKKKEALRNLFFRFTGVLISIGKFLSDTTAEFSKIDHVHDPEFKFIKIKLTKFHKGRTSEKLN